MKEVIVCDLDGTLIKTDLLFESLVAYLKKNPWKIFYIIFLMFTNVLKLKSFLAKNVEINPEFLPYRNDVINYLKNSNAELVLATASHEIYANKVAEYLGIFSRVLASNESVNLKSLKKLEEIKKHYSEFSYVGDSNDDLAIWKESKNIICVNKQISKKVENPIFLIENNKSFFKILLKTTRVTQWVKNILIFVPILMANKAFDPSLILSFFSFSLIASSVYVINDLMDLESDRRHIFKKYRPLAAGTISIPKAILIATICFTLGCILSLFINKSFILILFTYFTITTLYSFYLKSVVILDILTLAALYTIRIIAGGFSTDTYLSPWLLVFSMFLFLGLASIKRYAELARAKKDGKIKLHGRGYIPDDAELVSQFGTSSSYLAVLVLALYINSDVVANIYTNKVFLWGLCPLMLYWMTRLWLLAHRRHLLEDPIVFALRDKVSLVLGFLSIIIIFMAH